jgi:hypothetical protein
MHMRAVPLVALVLVALATPALAAGPVSAVATIDKRGITIGDPITLTVVAEADPAYRVVDSGVTRSMGDFELLETLKPQLTRSSDGRSRYSYTYRVSAYRTGNLVFPELSVRYQAPNGESGVVTTPSIPVVVTSVIRPGEPTDDIKPLKPQMRLPGGTPQLPPIVIQAGLAVVVLLMLALLVRQALRARRPEPVEGEARLTPAQRAMTELNRIAALGLPEKGRYAEHYALVSKALRTYVGDRFALSANERTPKELREDMLRAGIDRVEIATIYEILKDGEVARFHRTIWYPARAHHAIRSALEAMRRAAVAEQYDLMRQGQAS